MDSVFGLRALSWVIFTVAYFVCSAQSSCSRLVKFCEE